MDRAPVDGRGKQWVGLGVVKIMITLLLYFIYFSVSSSRACSEMTCRTVSQEIAKRV